MVLSEFILDESEDVLRRKFGWSDRRLRLELYVLRYEAIMVDPPMHISVIENDPSDNRILECAVRAGADYLVTGDRKHLLPIGEYEGVRIVRAPEFLSILDALRST